MYFSAVAFEGNNFVVFRLYARQNIFYNLLMIQNRIQKKILPYSRCYHYHTGKKKGFVVFSIFKRYRFQSNESNWTISITCQNIYKLL